MLLPQICIRRPVFATVLSTVLVVFGYIGYSRLPVRELPDIEFPIVSVSTVLPGASVTIKDGGPYGLILMQGHGTMGVWNIETPTLIRYGQLTNDEFFVSAAAAKEGVTITNPSDADPIVMLKHFGPDAHDNMPEIG